MPKSRKNTKINKKRNWREAFGEHNENNSPPLLKKKKIETLEDNVKIIKIKKPEKIITYDIGNMYKDFIIDNDLKIQFTKENLNIEIYEKEFFEIIEISSDGNCFFRSISKYIYGSEKNYAILRQAAYNYVVENLTKFYEFCYIEEGIYYIDIDEGGKIKKYVLDDYIEEIKKDKMFSGYIEINAISLIINRPIIILDTLTFKKTCYFRKLVYFNHKDWNSINIDEIIFINYVNNNHYQLLKPNNSYIVDRIKNQYKIDNKLIYYDKDKNKIIDTYEQLDIITDEKINISYKENSLTNAKSESDNSQQSVTYNNYLSKDKERDKFEDESSEYKNSKKSKNSINLLLENYEIKKTMENNSRDFLKKYNVPQNFDIKIYDEIIKAKKFYEKSIKNEKNEVIKTIPEYPILIGNKIDINYYTEIYHYLYVNNKNLSISGYPNRINNIKKKNSRENKKRDFRKKANKYYLHNEKLYFKTILKKNKNSTFNKKSKLVTIKSKQYLLHAIPEKSDIIAYLNNLHKEDGHRGISSLRKKLEENNIFFVGSSFLIDYIIKNCISCNEKNKKSVLKREPAKQILTFYPKQRYIMDITEIPNELKLNSKYLYLFNIIDHFSKYGMSYAIENKEGNTILKNLKNCLECNGFPEEIGSDNGKEFRNHQIEDYLKDKNIKYIHGNPYNPHSQGVVERFHKTVKDGLYCLYTDNPVSFNIKEGLDIVIKKYNNHIHSTTKYSPNQIFYSENEEFFAEVLSNIKISFKYIGKEFKNFKKKEKCLLNKKFKIKKKGNNKKAGVLVYDKIKNKQIYGKINVIVTEKTGGNYKIKIAKDYSDIDLYKNDLYLVDYKLLQKCSLLVWNSLIKNKSNTKEIIYEDDSINDEELNYIADNKDELE